MNHNTKKNNFNLWLLSGYLFLLIFRPFEYWHFLGEIHIERIYMIFFILFVFFSKQKRFLASSINIAILFYFITLLISGLFSINWDASWKVVEDYIKYLVFYSMVVFCVSDEEDFRFLIFVFIAVMALYVSKSAWEYFVHGRHVYRMGISRMVGIDVTFGHPNSFAASICYSLPLTWAMIRNKFESAWLRRFLWAYLGLALVAIIMTGSRSGMVTALLFFLILFLCSSHKTVSFFTIAIVLFFSWKLMPEYLQNRFLSTFIYDVGPGSAQESAEGRMVGFKHGLDLFFDNPVIGVGPNNYSLSWDIHMDAHNLYGQLLGELGLLGLISFGSLLVLMFIKNKNISLTVSHMSRNLDFNDSLSTQRAVNASSGNLCIIHHFNEVNIRKSNKTFFTNLGPVSLVFYSYVAQAIIQTLILMLFKGWGDHNLYRYTWLWLAALSVLGNHFFRQKVDSLNINI